MNSDKRQENVSFIDFLVLTFVFLSFSLELLHFGQGRGS